MLLGGVWFRSGAGWNYPVPCLVQELGVEQERIGSRKENILSRFGTDWFQKNSGTHPFHLECETNSEPDLENWNGVIPFLESGMEPFHP